MPILQTNANPPFNITRLSHVVLSSTDLERTRYFYETGLGLEVTDQTASALYLRAIEETSHHSLVFEKAEEGQPGHCRRLAFRMLDDDDLERAHEHFNKRGEQAEFVERPYQGRTLRVSDGVGVPLEFCATMDQSEPRMQNFHTHAGGKLVFLDHVQVACHDVAAAYQWYKRPGLSADRVHGQGRHR